MVRDAQGFGKKRGDTPLGVHPMEEYRDSSGRLSIELSGDDGEFRTFAGRLEKFGGRVRVQLDGMDERDWDFDLNGVTVVLHSDPIAGVSLHLEDGGNDDA